MKVITLDIGGTSIKSAMIENGCITKLKETPTNAKRGGEAVMLTCEEIIEQYSGFESIGISTAGQVDYKTGRILFANENIPYYTGMQVKERFQNRFNVPVAVENDVNCAALGEAYFGAGKHHESFLCLTYGTGIGGAIIQNKAVYHGAGYSAGEFGHILTHPNGKKCGCGQHGCYEKYASTTALVRNAKRYDNTAKDGRSVFLRIDNPNIQLIVNKWCDEVIFGLVSLIHIFNPSLVVLGGGIMNEPCILEYINQNLYRQIMPSYRTVQLKCAQLGNSAGLLGAYHLALSQEY